jgi:hypothetical protein
VFPQNFLIAYSEPYPGDEDLKGTVPPVWGGRGRQGRPMRVMIVTSVYKVPRGRGMGEATAAGEESQKAEQRRECLCCHSENQQVCPWRCKPLIGRECTRSGRSVMSVEEKGSSAVVSLK